MHQDRNNTALVISKLVYRAQRVIQVANNNRDRLITKSLQRTTKDIDNLGKLGFPFMKQEGVSVYGVQTPNSTDHPSQLIMDAEAKETKFCSNCKRDIAAANFVMHEVHCRRHIVLCEHCQEPVPRSEIEQHFNELHAKLPCGKCKLHIEKDKMEQHMNHMCERRPLLCEYCDLHFPKNEFDSHADFCGSRTECCPLCQQYVMLKDMRQHENSGCTYPPRKPSPPPQSSPRSAEMDPFSMLQMHQLLGGEDFGGPRVLPELASNVLRGFERNREHGPNIGQGEGARKNVPSKNGARGGRGTRRDPVRKKTDVNVQRANNLLSFSATGARNFEIPPDMDYDEMLALQMAHDDWLQDNQIETDGISPEEPSAEFSQFEASVWGRNSEGVEQILRNNRGSYEVNDATIPCEFCNVNMPLEDYMDHVENCTGSADGSNDLSHEDLNNEASPQLSVADRPSIPVINNLGTPSSIQSLQDYSHGHEEEFLLPCEFCEEMFPSEIIIQHQTVCQANGMATPRLTTPASRQHRNISHEPSGSFSPSLSNLRSNGHRTEHSLLDFVADLDENHFGQDLEDQRVPESRSNKYSAPFNRFDEAVARPPRRSSRPSVSEDPMNQQPDTDFTAGAARHAKRENSSAQRARARLNQLLQDDSDGIPSASGGASASGTRPVRIEKKTNVDSRSVMRQLDATRAKSNKNRPNGSQGSRTVPVDNNISRNNSSTTTTTSNGASQASSSGVRSRQRANHVFSPELRLKPDHNPRPKVSSVF
ncbi:TRAF-type zinc finger domain-containing 1 [Elysia marginata]|uniref:TRAF-type zinc finger domain-containing 1 n=1 Tax=Elysia marginata TaxID=1093978 RepID=A0AAV4ISQ8_9GAST|nr:TRAF-type zinc finger domain-containing 1 [Elysia marginata]